MLRRYRRTRSRLPSETFIIVPNYQLYRLFESRCFIPNRLGCFYRRKDYEGSDSRRLDFPRREEDLDEGRRRGEEEEDERRLFGSGYPSGEYLLQSSFLKG